jgi:hypothetical protein
MVGIGSARGAFEAGVCASAGVHASATAITGAAHTLRQSDTSGAGPETRLPDTSAIIGVTQMDVKLPPNFNCHFRTDLLRGTGLFTDRPIQGVVAAEFFAAFSPKSAFAL